MKRLCQIHPNSEKEILGYLRECQIDASVISRFGSIGAPIQGAGFAKRIDIGVSEEDFAKASSLLDEYYKKRNREIRPLTKGIWGRLLVSMLLGAFLVLLILVFTGSGDLFSSGIYGFVPFLGLVIFVLMERLKRGRCGKGS